MDFLIKNNIMKQSKIIVDMGEFATKIVSANYAARRVEITQSKSIDGFHLTGAGGIDISELAQRLDGECAGSGRMDMTVIVPGSMTENKVITIKNKKISDIPKIIEKEYLSFGKANRITHVIDYAYLGKREEQGDTLHYCMLSAVPKVFANELVHELAQRKMKVTGLVPGAFMQANLSEMYFDDYDDLNRLFIDFGTNCVRVSAFSEGVMLYTREIDYGFSTYFENLFYELDKVGKREIRDVLLDVGIKRENVVNEHFFIINEKKYYECVDKVADDIIGEILRIVNMCENNDVSISKIYYTGFLIPGFEEELIERSGLKCEQIKFERFDAKEGKGYVFKVMCENFNTEFSNTIGAAIYPLI